MKIIAWEGNKASMMMPNTQQQHSDDHLALAVAELEYSPRAGNLALSRTFTREIAAPLAVLRPSDIEQSIL
jgi:hypothetical protein